MKEEVNKIRKHTFIKRAVATILAMCMMVGMGTTVFADEGDGDNSTRYIACPNGGKHQMYSVGMGVVYDTDTGTERVRVYKCSGCGLHVGCQFIPFADKALGGYATSYSPENIGGAYQFYGGFEGAYYNLQEDSFIQGFQWH